MEFSRRQSPYWSARVAVPSLMLQVLLALVPAALAHVWFFGPGFIFNLLVASLFAVAFLRESFEPFHAVALGFVLGGIWTAERGKAK